MTSLNALRMFKQGADEEKAEVARLSSFVGAMAIGDLVKSTLGPKVGLIHQLGLTQKFGSDVLHDIEASSDLAIIL